ncbi:MAG: hypothetical protein OXC11_07290 [Rhodospirillales bacterium]|nr:hypothetical protein [Rhodospirillales bacterium]
MSYDVRVQVNSGDVDVAPGLARERTAKTTGTAPSEAPALQWARVNGAESGLRFAAWCECRLHGAICWRGAMAAAPAPLSPAPGAAALAAIPLLPLARCREWRRKRRRGPRPRPEG